MKVIFVDDDSIYETPLRPRWSSIQFSTSNWRLKATGTDQLLDELPSIHIVTVTSLY
jgi:hypothetical protein